MPTVGERAGPCCQTWCSPVWPRAGHAGLFNPQWVPCSCSVSRCSRSQSWASASPVPLILTTRGPVKGHGWCPCATQRGRRSRPGATQPVHDSAGHCAAGEGHRPLHSVPGEVRAARGAQVQGLEHALSPCVADLLRLLCWAHRHPRLRCCRPLVPQDDASTA